MTAADPAKHNKDYFHQAIPHFPPRGKHCCCTYHHRLTGTLLESHVNEIIQYVIFCTASYIQPFFFEIHSCCGNC